MIIELKFEIIEISGEIVNFISPSFNEIPSISPFIFLNNIIDLSPKNSKLVSFKNISSYILELKFVTSPFAIKLLI